LSAVKKQPKTAPGEPDTAARRRRKCQARKAAIGVRGVARKPAGASPAPRCASFKEFLRDHARVLQRDGAGGPFTLQGRAPLEVVVDWLDKILRNTIGVEQKAESAEQKAKSRKQKAEMGSPSTTSVFPLSAFPISAFPQAAFPIPAFCPESVEIDGVTFAPGQLKGASLAVGGGAQFGKTVLELNLMAYATAVRFLSVGNYLPDRPKVEEIVGQKFRPNVLDLYPWMAEMIQLGKVENASGKTINRKESYTVTDGERKSFGSFCGMHKPPTSITIDLALLDEVDDIPDRNIGYVDARMTSSPVHLTCFIGTQRVAGAGQNARLKASSFHVKMVPCPKCGREWCLEEEFPRCVRVSHPNLNLNLNPPEGRLGLRAGLRLRGEADPVISPEMGHDRLAHYYAACPECGCELDRDSGRYVAKHPERIAQARLGLRVSQLDISAISMQEIVGAWYAAFEDPSGNALAAFYCDRIAIPNAGAAQPITQAVLEDCRRLGLGETAEAAEPYAMSLGALNLNLNLNLPAERAGLRLGLRLGAEKSVRFAGMDLGPRCWFWCDEVRGPLVSACLWAELIASGNAPARVPILMQALGIQCLLLDAGGEPDLTKRLVLALNGLENYQPPLVPKNDLLKMRLYNLGGAGILPAGAALSWDGERAQWRGLRAAAVLFVAGEAKGLEQTIGFTAEGRIYPLIKCNRAESIQTAVNDFLTPAEGVIEMLREGRGSRVEGGTASARDRPTAVPPLDTRPSTLRALRRARLPQTYIGPGVSQAVLDGHLLNLRKERNPRTGAEEWIDGVENHLGLAKTYARLAQTLAQTNRAPPSGAITSLEGIRFGGAPGVPHFQPGRVR